MLLTRGDFRTPLSSRYPTLSRYRELVGRDSLVFYRDDREATVTVQRSPWGELSLKLNGKVDASTSGDMPNQTLIAHIPLLLRPGAREVMVVGLGSGVTAGSALAHPIERLDVVEFSPAVVDAARLFSAYNRRALDDPRLHLTLDDAKAYLKTAPRNYDAILSEPSNMWIAGVAGLFTAEFYRDAKARLKPGGVFAQWFHLYEMNDETLALILRTFASQFQGLSLWETTSGKDVVLIGSNGPLDASGEAAAREYGRPEVREDLARVGLKSLRAALGLQVCGDAGLRAAAGTGPLNEDRFPRLEYEAPKAFWLQRFARLPASCAEARP